MLYIDDLKLFPKSEEQVNTLVRTALVLTGVEFGMKKCGILTMKTGKVVRCEGVMLPNNEVMKEVEKEGYTYLGIVELDKIKEDEMKTKTIKRRRPKIKTNWEKQNNSNKYMGSGGIQIWSRNTTVERE